MFSGKSGELIRSINRTLIANKTVLAVKPSLDTRSTNIHSRSAPLQINNFGKQFFFQLAKHSSDLLEFTENIQPDLLAIDEAQFFSSNLVQVIQTILSFPFDKKIIIAGLDMDAWGKPFGPIPELMCIADSVVKLTAVCFKCKNEYAIHTFKKSVGKGEGNIEVGDTNIYEARCRECWYKPRE